MNAIQKIAHWGDTHHPAWMDLLRIGLGVLLFYKGIQFGRHPQDLHVYIEGRDLALWSLFTVHYIPMIHIAGGLLIALGLITRAAIIFQLPILVGAVLFTGTTIGVFDIYSEFGLSLSVLILLVIFLIYGSGPLSVDESLRKHPGG